MKEYATESGRHELLVGASSGDVRLHARVGIGADTATGARAVPGSQQAREKRRQGKVRVLVWGRYKPGTARAPFIRSPSRVAAVSRRTLEIAAL